MPRAQLTTDELESMRSRLCSAALELYRQEGLEAISFRRLAEAVGLSHTLPYRYFENKEALLARMRTEGMQRFESFIRAHEQPSSTPLARVRAIALAYIEYARMHPADYLLVFASHQPSPEQYPELLAARRSLFEHAVDAVQQCEDTGALDGDARQIAHAFWVSLHGLMSLHAANQLVHGYDIDELVEPLIARLLGQAAAPASPHPIDERATTGLRAGRRFRR